MNFPSIVVDDFYKNPDAIREFALSLPFSESTPFYPGNRTEQLWKVAPEFFEYSCYRFFSLYFDMTTPVNWNVSTQFQLIYPDEDPLMNIGVVHKDPAEFAGILYLNPDPDPDTGTSLYSPIVDNPQYQYKHEDWDDILKHAYNPKMDRELIVKTIQQHNSQFEKTVEVKNRYNRLIAFDNKQNHAASLQKLNKNTPRLTQTFFIEKIESEIPPPLKRIDSWNKIQSTPLS